MGARVYVWKSKFYITMLPQSLSALVRQCLLLNLGLADLVELAGQCVPVCLPRAGITGGHGFYMGAGDLNTGPHTVCVPSTLPTEPSLPILMANLLNFLIFKFLKINRITKTTQKTQTIVLRFETTSPFGFHGNFILTSYLEQ